MAKTFGGEITTDIIIDLLEGLKGRCYAAEDEEITLVRLKKFVLLGLIDDAIEDLKVKMELEDKDDFTNPIYDPVEGRDY